MSSSSCAGTGVLIFNGKAVVTPVLRGLFLAFKLDETYPAEDRLYICTASNESRTWEAVLTNVLEELDIEFVYVGDGIDWKGTMSTLASRAEDSEEARSMLESLVESLDQDAELETVVDLAHVMKDGHNLDGVSFEAGITCYRPVLGEFGGFGIYHSPSVSVTVSSQKAERIGVLLKEAVGGNDGAMKTLCDELESMVLSGVANPVKRALLKQKLADHFAEQAVSA